MAEARTFRLSGSLSLEDVAHALEDFLRTQKHLDTEGVSQGENSYFIQARQTESWKKFMGLDQAIQVQMEVYGNTLSVNLGAGRWVDKLGAATVGYIIFAPLLITAAIGAIGQGQLPEDIFDFVERYTFWGKPLDINEFINEAEAKKKNHCESCGSILPEGARFCPGCGKSIVRAQVCPVCGGTVTTKDARFCPNCGAPLN